MYRKRGVEGIMFKYVRLVVTVYKDNPRHGYHVLALTDFKMRVTMRMTTLFGVCTYRLLA